MNPLIGGIVATVGELVDDLHTSDKERLDAELELRKVGLEERKLDLSVQMGQIEVNKEEAKHASIFTSGWRPAVGWACVGGLSYQVVFRPIFGWIMTNTMQWSAPPVLEMETLMTLLFGMLGMSAYRTYEKKQGVTT